MKHLFLFAALGCIAWSLSAEAADNPLGAHSNAPIEITADNLEVFQQENRAVFSGHVIAIQGEIRLKSDKMIVYYKKSEEKTDGKAAKKASGNNALQQNAIQKIDVEGNVFLSTPQETASGASGQYNVEEHTIYLNNNVVLTRGNNTLKGEKLAYNMETGKSILTGGTTAEQGAAKGNRVRALFVPENKDNKTSDTPPKQAP